MGGLMSYWYHFAIMFEALFILTTIDAGTRVARFILQELAGRLWKPMARTDWMPGTLLSSAAIVVAWAWFILNGSIASIWPMFGISNQLLAATALCVGTTVIINSGRARYAWVTGLPLAFVATTTLTAGWQSIFDNFLPLATTGGQPFLGYLNATLAAVMMGCVGVILFESMRRWLAVLRGAAGPPPA